MWVNTSVSTRVAGLSVFPVFNSVCTDHMTACLPQWANEPTPRRPFVVFPDINLFKVGVCRRISVSVEDVVMVRYPLQYISDQIQDNAEMANTAHLSAPLMEREA